MIHTFSYIKILIKIILNVYNFHSAPFINNSYLHQCYYNYCYSYLDYINFLVLCLFVCVSFCAYFVINHWALKSTRK
jgi:hypothetical protein